MTNEKRGNSPFIDSRPNGDSATAKPSKGSGPVCRRCGKPVSYGNIYCKACGGTGVRFFGEN